MNANDPYLEYYETEEAMLQNTPINIIFLDSCLGVVRDGNLQRQTNSSFTLILRERYLKLVAETRYFTAEISISIDIQFC